MPIVRAALRPVAVAPLLAAGGLLLGPAPAAHACSPIPSPTAEIPIQQATEEDRRWVIATGPDFLEVVLPRPLPPGSVLFDGTAVATRYSPRAGAPTWTFRVERVLWGDLPREVVVVGDHPDGGCSLRVPSYQVGVSRRMAAVVEPTTGDLRPLLGRYEAPRLDPRPAHSLLGWPAASGGAALATWLTLAFLAEVADHGLAMLAGAVYLRARELDLEEREAARRS